MRSVFYTEAQIDEAYQSWAPKLREYAALCRLKDPLPDADSLSAAHREQYRMLRLALEEYRDAPIHVRDRYVDVYHGSPITLLAAGDVFDLASPSIVALLSEERHRWFRDVFRGPDGWFGSCWVTIDEQVPKSLAEDLAAYFPKPHGFCYWLLTKARAGNARHEVVKWDGATAVSLGPILQQCTEEGFIDDLQGA